MKLLKTLLFILFFFPIMIEGKTYVDMLGKDIHSLFQKSGATYVIRYEHTFADTLYIQEKCEIKFEGGRLAGPIVFNNTKLKGQVNLTGSSIHGKIANKIFNAAWLCAIDGKTDDAKSINEIIEVCGNVFFPKEYTGSNRFIVLNVRFHKRIVKQ